MSAEANIQVKANNIANLNTIGFKKSGVLTTDLFYNNLQKAGATENIDGVKCPLGVQIGSGSKVSVCYL